MYKVLLVDDEINILEGIASIVDWSGCGTQLVHKASNGQMAFEMIEADPPDIVVTDIKMPGLNGVQLIQKVHQLYPDIKFIVLSGYDEFEFAKTVMVCNVRHYLLKPSNEKKIESALKDVVFDLDDKKDKETFLENMRSHLQSIMPKAKEQFLKDYITNKKYDVQDWEYYSRLFEIDTTCQEFRLLVLAIDERSDYEHQLTLKEMVTEKLAENHFIPLETTIGDKIIILAEVSSFADLNAELKEVQQTFEDFFKITFTAAISNPGSISKLRELYNETLNCLTQRFYISGGSIITVQDFIQNKSNFEEMQYDHENLIFAIRSGNDDEVQQYLDDFFREVREKKYDANLVKSHCLELFLAIIRQAKDEEMDDYFQEIIFFQQQESLRELRKFIERAAKEIASQYFERTKQTHHNIVERVIEYVEQNLEDEELSLSSIAADILYMNPDYLGKLFKKQKGERFSNFLTSLRIKKAIQLIEESDHVKVFEVAEKVGFGNNPRYFGQVFKKQTGMTPSDYKDKQTDK
ncbi:hypothetical protein GCM10007216_13320 [Thalassobacillus devorans]|uniref:Two-component system response regulator YesN n=1 Tax=Thalassobacillus devorans TaxID=279813 RepID=A0ABQ1NVM2_9BACI|nr:response regulator [Thalassobacillus devorans]NIK28727.1 two-component system response regulator YesN [Thalassobacillus devorans]GGC84021.1 hypothetical protein GCM10007216_13320 [Thalassobacillus devorans]